ncbi:MAG TPA: acyl-CoA dehydrogenase family protein [Vicinamibacterales bacterium]|jgi:acyl-CoA dehydrogenase|nr:acyl-CoA dehydrogenase family protein [Vicinamibacterales bacterium]
MIDLPFFEDRHRSLQERLRGIAAVFDPIALRGEAGEVDAAGRDAVRECARLDLCRLLIPREYGGTGLDLRSVCLARETLAARSGLADAVFAVQGLGSYPIVLGGTRELAARHLPAVAEGAAIAAFALTEPDAGSDASALETRATRDGDEYVLDGRKTFISNAPIATFFTVFARTAEGTKRSLSAFVVDAAAAGLSIGPVQEIIAPHPIAELRLDACRVPAGHLLGVEGDGMRLALGTLDFFRTSVGAAACGLASRALTESLARARVRRQFGSAIAEFQLTQAALADMATELDAARLLVYRAASMKDAGAARVTREAAMAKLFATEAAQRIVDRAVQIHGGVGVQRGSLVERLYREVRAPRIYEGTSEIQRLVIARDLLGHA